MHNRHEAERASPFFIVLFWSVVGVGVLLAIGAIVAGGYAH